MAMKDLVRWGGAGKKGAPERREGEHPLAGFQREVSDLFDRFFEGFDREPFGKLSLPMADFRPRIDLAETDKEIEVSAELPGLDEKDVEVSLSDGVLTLRGERREEKEEKQKDWYRREQTYGSFHRAIQLPCDVDAEKVEATFKKGILTVKLPKAQPSQSKKISVNIA